MGELLPYKIFRLKNVYGCTIIERINRFVVEVKLDDTRYVKAHINNTGRLADFIVRGKKAYCFQRDKVGKTRYRLFAVDDCGKGAIVDTYLQMKSFEIAIYKNYISWLKNCEIVKRNVLVGTSRLDYLIECSGKKIYLEVKSAVLRGNKHVAMYPDCRSVRGQKHIMDLIKHVEGGGKGIILFISGLPNVKAFKPYKKGDPIIYELLKKAMEKCVKIRAINIFFEPKNNWIYLERTRLKILL
ncbi:MAG: DNA/RNA nuclease SfsA [Thermofilum sp. ex4484_79]|nr:MAG: DNA/RNA nuclease SfsA [Thermofilum sp. ex4484_79]